MRHPGIDLITNETLLEIIQCVVLDLKIVQLVTIWQEKSTYNWDV